ncbi:MAG: hypothetical protein FJY20_01105 [Bacteroidetes bacterium]|nr:hypothetical protein [Bacteroidota bacterium]
MLSKTDIEKYFNAEKAESLLFMAIGAAAVAAAIVFLFVLNLNFYRGAAIPMILVGLILSAVGYTVYKRSDNDRIRNVYALDMNPSELKNKELPRMKTVMKNFAIYRRTEICLLLLGAGLYGYFIRDFKYDFWRGFGLALAVMALLAVTADYFAERRGRIYTRGLEEL